MHESKIKSKKFLQLTTIFHNVVHTWAQTFQHLSLSTQKWRGKRLHKSIAKIGTTTTLSCEFATISFQEKYEKKLREKS